MVKSKLSFKTINWQQLGFFCLAFITLLLPFQPKFLPITLGIMVLGLFWLLSAQFSLKLKNLARNPMAGLLFLYYLILVLGLFYSANLAKAEKDVGLKIPLLVLPIMLGSMQFFKEAGLQKLLRFFVYSAAVSVLVCLVNALVNYAAFSHYQVFYFRNFSFYRFIPPHYLGMYINLAYALVLFGFFGSVKLIAQKRKAIFVLAVLAIGLVFISVRMQFLIFLLINLWGGFAFVKNKHGKRWSLLLMLGIAAFFLGLTLAFRGSRTRLIDTYNELKSINKPVENKQTNARFFLWPAATKVIGNNFWLGTGGGAENEALTQMLKSEEALFWDGSRTFLLHEKKYNYHNSFLQHFAAHGFFGILSFLALFVFPFLKKKRTALQTMGLVFLVVSALSFSTESMLQRQAGVLYFAFFYCLFFVHTLSPKITNKAL